MAGAAGLAVVGLLVIGYSFWPSGKHANHGGAAGTNHLAAGTGNASSTLSDNSGARGWGTAPRGNVVVYLDDVGDGWSYSGGGNSRCVVSGIVDIDCAKADPDHWHHKGGQAITHRAEGSGMPSGQRQVVNRPEYLPGRVEASPGRPAEAVTRHEIVTKPGYMPNRVEPAGVPAASRPVGRSEGASAPAFHLGGGRGKRS